MSDLSTAYGMKKRAKRMAEGGEVENLNQMGDMDEGAGGMNEVPPIIMKIMMGREQGYSEGGRVANSDEPEADFSPNEFDDLHLDDNLEPDSMGEDEIGDDQENMDRKDMIKKIMSSRSKKDRNPSPA